MNDLELLTNNTLEKEVSTESIPTLRNSSIINVIRNTSKIRTDEPSHEKETTLIRIFKTKDDDNLKNKSIIKEEKSSTVKNDLLQTIAKPNDEHNNIEQEVSALTNENINSSDAFSKDFKINKVLDDLPQSRRTFLGLNKLLDLEKLLDLKILEKNPKQPHESPPVNIKENKKKNNTTSPRPVSNITHGCARRNKQQPSLDLFPETTIKGNKSVETKPNVELYPTFEEPSAQTKKTSAIGPGLSQLPLNYVPGFHQNLTSQKLPNVNIPVIKSLPFGNNRFPSFSRNGVNNYYSTIHPNFGPPTLQPANMQSVRAPNYLPNAMPYQPNAQMPYQSIGDTLYQTQSKLPFLQNLPYPIKRGVLRNLLQIVSNEI